MLLGFEIPTVMFQSLNAGFIIYFATVVAGYYNRKLKSKEASSFLKWRLVLSLWF
jgi:POT family proton-dependent oligopeptide transporter